MFNTEKTTIGLAGWQQSIFFLQAKWYYLYCFFASIYIIAIGQVAYVGKALVDYSIVVESDFHIIKILNSPIGHFELTQISNLYRKIHVGGLGIVAFSIKETKNGRLLYHVL